MLDVAKCKRWLFLFFCALFASTTSAHPPWNPYDATRFAPVRDFGPKVGVEVVTDGITSPLKAIHAPGEPNFLYVVDQPGIVWRVNLLDPNPATNKTVFLDVRTLVGPLGVCGPNTFDERGLLGLAFHPNYRLNGKFYTYTSEQTVGAVTFPGSPTGVNPDHDNVVSEWQGGTRRELIRVTWPQFNHDGGDLAFGPDGKLYISMGDGGAADDSDGEPFILAQPRYPQKPDCSLAVPSSGHQIDGNGQKLNTPLGKVLRIDVNCTPGMGGTCNSSNRQYNIPADNPFVNTPGAVKEIWAFGFRNPYRFSFDRRSGDLYLGDVGQNDIEEVDIVTRGGNYGWNCKEGTKFFHSNGTDVGTANDEPRAGCEPSRLMSFVDPIAQYDTHHEGHSVVAGFVYHGNRVPALRGKYVFGEFSLLFKFPSGPHDYGRLFVINAGGNEGHVDSGHGQVGHGLRQISEVLVLPGSKVSLAVLGIGQDAQGEIYVMGNVSGVPFGQNGRVLRLAPPPDPITDD